METHKCLEQVLLYKLGQHTESTLHTSHPEEVGRTFINVRSHVPFAALNYIPRCIPASN